MIKKVQMQTEINDRKKNAPITKTQICFLKIVNINKFLKKLMTKYKLTIPEIQE